MDLSLQLYPSQQLNLTPQLQQAIRLLQLSTIELQQEIQLAIESNPMLDLLSLDDEKKEELSTTPEETEYQWSPLCGNKIYEEHELSFDNLHCTTLNLQDHFRWQLSLTPMSEVDLAIAIAIIDAMDENGFMTLSLEELHYSLSPNAQLVEYEEIEAVRHRLQHFDPLGCASYHLAESLLIQLKQYSSHVLFDKMKQILKNDIDLLGQHNYKLLRKKYQLTANEVQEVLQTIHKLNPKPGSVVQHCKIEYIVPDVIVKKIAGTWQVLLNPYTLPRLSINQHYASLIQRGDHSNDNIFLKTHLQEARWFIKSIKSRQDTLLKVASSIIHYQKNFLDQGDEAMKPLVLNDIACALGMHESTISRITTQKYIHTPRGVFELKYFFSSHLSTELGDHCSSTAIKAIIKKLIATENRKKPLSDNLLAKLIGAQGVPIARRTVAKYRDVLGIAPSHTRKLVNK